LNSIPLADAHFEQMPDLAFCCKKSTGNDSSEASKPAIFVFENNFFAIQKH